MAGVRVYELARDLGISSKNLIDELRNQGIEVKSHMSTMDEDTAGLVLDLYRPHATTVATNPPPAESPTMLSSTFTPPTTTPPAELVSPAPPLEPTNTIVRLPEALTVKDFAEALQFKTRDVLMQLMSLGTVASINTVIGLDLANTVAQKLGKDVLLLSEEEAIERSEDNADIDHLEPRAPVVTIMGHVDHGKTSLLDAIREANIQATEVGGITQHIGAYEVETPKGKLVFLDTPGHEAFTAMRARGAQITDIVVLVVAANDGVMPQTREAIAHAKAAGVPIVVAINKIDLPDANPDRVKQQLSELELIPEEWGGSTIFVEVSAKRKVGLGDLLEMILLQAEILELQSDTHQLAKGTIVEAKLDKTRGPVATVLIQKGTLHVGDAYVAGVHYGRVRAMFDDRGRKVTVAGPATPIEVLGFADVPAAGDTFAVVEDERKARHISSIRQDRLRAKQLSKLESDKVRLRLIHGSTGAITESDVMLASASNAIVIGFSVRPIPKAAELAVQEHVDIRLYTVIYEAISDVEKAMVGLLKPTYSERILGRAEVRMLFHISRIGAIAGCQVREGMIRRNTSARVLRDNVVVHEGRIASLRRVKEDVEEVAAGFECGIGLGRYQDIKEGDVIEAFILEEVAPRL